MKPEEFGEVSDIIKRSDCDKKDEAILQGVMPAKNLHRSSREPWKYFMTLDEMVGVYPVLQNSMLIHQSIDNILALYCKFYDKKASTMQTTLDKLLKKK